MKFGIIIPTYYRKDKTTKFYLTRALDSIFKQKYQDFKIYLIGDRYENEEEINEITSKYKGDNFYFENLKVAKERDFYTNKYAIWSYGGVNATNYAIDISLSEGNDYICHLDHDDYWSENHLEVIKDCIESTGSDWVCTKSLYVGNRVLPEVFGNEKYINYLPKPQSLIHSSVCMNFKNIPLKYRDLFSETGSIGLPTDAELWYRTGRYIIENKLKSTLINEITCYHVEEGYERK
jgi:glycosyltransferase involved in cell wall biosynthesis